MLKIRGCGSGKSNALLNLTSNEQDVGKVYLYAKNLNNPKYRLLIKKSIYMTY